MATEKIYTVTVSKRFTQILKAVVPGLNVLSFPDVPLREIVLKRPWI